MAPSKSTKALVQSDSDTKPVLVQKDVELPGLSDKQFYIDVQYAAQNPTDVQTLDSNAFGDGTVLGCDFAGLVTEVGNGVSKCKAGNSIAGLIWGGEVKGLGAYSHATIGDEDICFKIPPSISAAEAATVPLACCTAWLALFSKDCLAINRDQTPKPTVLVWGGSSSVGLYTIQLAALYNFNIITTCSPANFDLVKSMGAAHAFSYKSDDVIDQIKAAAPDVMYVFDTIGSESSSEQASQAVQKDEGGVLCTVRPGKAFTEKVKEGVRVTDVLVWTAFLKDHQYKEFRWPASQADHNLATELFDALPDLLESKKVKPSSVKEMSGLESVKMGFQMHRDGKISASKIVYKI